MRARCIVIKGDRQSEEGFGRLLTSHEAVGNQFPLEAIDATTPREVAERLAAYKIRWNYPDGGLDHFQGLKRHAYKTSNPEARKACFLSHYRLWVYAQAEPILILEDDALFVRKLDYKPLMKSTFGAIGVNDPRGATRRPARYHAGLQARTEEIGEVPWIDEEDIPQGLAGASAYLMKPWAATQALYLAELHGAWPNDALLCRQLAPWIGCTKTYYTTIQRTPSRLA